MKAKLVARGVVQTLKYMDHFSARSPNGRITLATPFKTAANSHVHIEVRPHQIREMLEVWRPLDLSMSDRIVVYRLEACMYHVTFEGMEGINV
jgi:hypothetical protein